VIKIPSVYPSRSRFLGRLVCFYRLSFLLSCLHAYVYTRVNVDSSLLAWTDRSKTGYNIRTMFVTLKLDWIFEYDIEMIA